MPRRSLRRRGRPEGPASGSRDVLFGVHPVREALQGRPQELETLWALPGARAVEPLVAAARARGIAVELTDHETLDRLTERGHHQGVAVRARPFSYIALADLLGRGAALLVAVDGITDPQNLGSIIRSAETMGAGGLILPRDRTVPVTAAVVRASAGATAHLPVAQVVNLARSLGDAKDKGYWIVGLDADGSTGFHELPPLERALVVVGSEGHGSRRLVREACDFAVRIPVRGRVRSLNAAVAAAIGLYALSEQLERGANR